MIPPLTDVAADELNDEVKYAITMIPLPPAPPAPLTVPLTFLFEPPPPPPVFAEPDIPAPPLLAPPCPPPADAKPPFCV